MQKEDAGLSYITSLICTRRNNNLWKYQDTIFPPIKRLHRICLNQLCSHIFQAPGIRFFWSFYEGKPESVCALKSILSHQGCSRISQPIKSTLLSVESVENWKKPWSLWIFCEIIKYLWRCTNSSKNSWTSFYHKPGITQKFRQDRLVSNY